VRPLARPGSTLAPARACKGGPGTGHRPNALDVVGNRRGSGVGNFEHGAQTYRVDPRGRRSVATTWKNDLVDGSCDRFGGSVWTIGGLPIEERGGCACASQRRRRRGLSVRGRPTMVEVTGSDHRSARLGERPRLVASTCRPGRCRSLASNRLRGSGGDRVRRWVRAGRGRYARRLVSTSRHGGCDRLRTRRRSPGRRMRSASLGEHVVVLCWRCVWTDRGRAHGTVRPSRRE